jgi:hypothetical protein
MGTEKNCDKLGPEFEKYSAATFGELKFGI